MEKAGTIVPAFCITKMMYLIEVGNMEHSCGVSIFHVSILFP